MAKQHYVEVMVRPVAAPGAAAQVARQLEVQLGGKIQLKVEARVDRRMAADLAAIRKTADETASALNRMAAAGAKPAAALETTARSARSASAAIKHLNELTARGTTHAERFGQQIGLAAQRFGAFTAATAGVFGLTSALGKAVSEAVAFDLALNKLRQVSDGSAAEIRTMGREIGDLSVRLGVSSKELAEVSVQFAQAGLNAKQTREALQAVAQTALAPNFESMKQTTEGAIAAFQQFGRDASKLKDQLGAMNAVAGAFAVEAQDLVVATQKAGGSFSALGDDLNELLGLFTSVRATTRESAESIATGLRTIFARLQRQDTVDALSNLNIQLRYTAAEATALGRVDLQGQFVGAYEAVRRLSEGLEGLRTTDPKFAQVTEQLGGYRQISRVIPLLQQFGEAQKAVNVARLGGVSLAINEAQRMEAVSNRLTRMGEAWQKVFNDAGQSRGVQQLADLLERAATAAAKLAEVLIPVLPVLAGSAIGFGGRAAAKALPNVTRPHDYKPHTPPPRRFAGGGEAPPPSGLVPGVGNTDSVPLMLPAGSFVVRKQAVQALGAGNLAAMAGRYAGGGSNSQGGSPALVMPGEYVVTPSQARAIGYGRLYGLNAAGRGTRPQKLAGGGAKSVPYGDDEAVAGYARTAVGLLARKAGLTPAAAGVRAVGPLSEPHNAAYFPREKAIRVGSRLTRSGPVLATIVGHEFGHSLHSAARGSSPDPLGETTAAEARLLLGADGFAAYRRATAVALKGVYAGLPADRRAAFREQVRYKLTPAELLADFFGGALTGRVPLPLPDGAGGVEFQVVPRPAAGPDALGVLRAGLAAPLTDEAVLAEERAGHAADLRRHRLSALTPAQRLEAAGFALDHLGGVNEHLRNPRNPQWRKGPIHGPVAALTAHIRRQEAVPDGAFVSRGLAGQLLRAEGFAREVTVDALADRPDLSLTDPGFLTVGAGEAERGDLPVDFLRPQRGVATGPSGFALQRGRRVSFARGPDGRPRVRVFAAGGRVPGFGFGDKVPALLEPGEEVIRRDAAVPNRAALAALNATGRLPRFADGGVHEELKRLGLYGDYSSALGSVAGSSVRIGNRSVPGAELVGRAAIKIAEMSPADFAKSLVDKGGFQGDAEAAMAAAANDPAVRENVRAAMKKMVFKLAASLADRASRKVRDGSRKTIQIATAEELAGPEAGEAATPAAFDHVQAAKRVMALLDRPGVELPERLGPKSLRRVLDIASGELTPKHSKVGDKEALGLALRGVLREVDEAKRPEAISAVLGELGLGERKFRNRAGGPPPPTAPAPAPVPLPPPVVTAGRPPVDDWAWMVENARAQGAADFRPAGPAVRLDDLRVSGINGRAARAWDRARNQAVALAPAFAPEPAWLGTPGGGPKDRRGLGLLDRFDRWDRARQVKTERALGRLVGGGGGAEAPAAEPPTRRPPRGVFRPDDRLPIRGEFAEDRVDVRDLLDRLSAATGIDPRGLTKQVLVDRGVTDAQMRKYGAGFRGSFNEKTGLTRINTDEAIPETELARVLAHEVFGHGTDRAMTDRAAFARIVAAARPMLQKRLKAMGYDADSKDPKKAKSAQYAQYAASDEEAFARVMEDAVLAQAGIANESPLSKGLSQKVDPADLAAAMAAARAKNPVAPPGATPGGPQKPPTQPPTPGPTPPPPPDDDGERHIPRTIKDLAERQRLARQAVADESAANVAMGGEALTLAEAQARMRAMQYGDVPLPEERRAYRDSHDARRYGPMGGGSGYVDRTVPPHLPPRDPPRQVGFLDNVNAEAAVPLRGAGLYSKATSDLFDTTNRTRDGFVDLGTGGERAQKALLRRQKELMAAIERDARKAGADRKEAKLLAQELSDRISLDNMAGVEYDEKGRLTGPSSALYSQLGQGRLFAVADAEERAGQRRAGGRGFFRRAAGKVGAGFAAVSDFNTRLNDALERRGVNTTAVALTAGAAGGYAAEYVRPNETQLALAGRSESADSRVAGGTALSSTLSGAATGLGAGAAFGPIGAAVGLVAGAGIGLAMGLKEAARQVADAKIGAAVEDLGSSLGRVGRGLNSLNDLSDVTTTITTLRNEAAGKAAAEVGSDRPLEEQRAANLKQFRLAAGPQLFAAGQALSKESERLAKESPGGTAAQFEAKLRGSPNASALAGLLADLGVYRDFNEAVKELGKETAKAAAAIKVKNQLDADQANTRRAAAFLGQLAEVAERAADGLGGMRDRLDVLAGGRPGPRGLADSLDLFTADRDGRAAAIGALRAQGATGGAFADRLDVLAKVADRLPDALTALAGNADERGLQGLIGGDTAAEKQVAAAIANALEAAASKDGGSLAKLLSEGVGPLAQQLIGEQADPVLAQARRFQGVRDAQRQFLAEGFGRGEQVGAEARGFRADAGRLGGDVAAAERAARARAGGFDPTDLATLGELRRPFLSAQDDLLKGTGLTSASTPEELGAALRRNQDARTLNVEKVRPTAQTADEIFAVEREFARLADVGARTKAALENLAKSGDLAAAAQQKVAAADGSINSRRSAAERALFADPAERARMGRQILAAQEAARNKDGFVGLGRTRQRDVIAGLNELGSSRLPTGERADELKKVFLDKLLPGGQAGLQGKELSEREAADKEYVAALKTQREAAAQLGQDADARQKEFLEGLKAQFDRFFAASEQGFAQSQAGQDLGAAAVAARETKEAKERAEAVQFLKDRAGAKDSEQLKKLRNITPDEAEKLAKNRRAVVEEERLANQFTANRVNVGDASAVTALNLGEYRIRNFWDEAYKPSEMEDAAGPFLDRLGVVKGEQARDVVLASVAARQTALGNTGAATKLGRDNRLVYTIQEEVERYLRETDKYATPDQTVAVSNAIRRVSKGDNVDFAAKTDNRQSGVFRAELEERYGLNARPLETFSDDELKKFKRSLELIGARSYEDVQSQLEAAEQKEREAKKKLKRAGGGWVSRGGTTDHASKGTDTVSAILTPDEFVVDARTAKANAPLLEWMRGRGRPVYRAGGGFGATVVGGRPQPIAFDEYDRLGWNALPATTAGFGGQNPYASAKPAGLGGGKWAMTNPGEAARRLVAAQSRRRAVADLRAERAFYNTGNAARLAFGADDGQSRAAMGAVDFARRQSDEATGRSQRLADRMWGRSAPPVPPAVEGAGTAASKKGVFGSYWAAESKGGPPDDDAAAGKPSAPLFLRPSRPGDAPGGAPPADDKLSRAMDEFNQKGGRLADGFVAFGQKVDKLVEALEKIPQSIKMDATAKHEVVLNDGGLLAKLGDFQDKILAAAETLIDKRIDERVPDSLKPPGRGDRNA